MALHKSEDQNNTQAQPHVDPNQMNQQPNYQQNPQMNQQNMGWSFHSNNMFAPISKALGSDYLLKLQEYLREIYKTAGPGYEISIRALDNNNIPMLRFSALLVCVKIRNAKPERVAYHVLLLGATGEKISPLVETLNQQQIEITRVESDAIDAKLLSIAQEAVESFYPQHQAFFADAEVVPRDFNIEDKARVHMLAYNAGQACCYQLELVAKGKNYTDYNIEKMKGGSNLVVKMGVPRTTIEGILGEPIRADILINFVSELPRIPGNREVSLNTADQQTKVSEVAGFIDTIWCPMDTNNSPFQPVQQVNTQKYAARFVITNIASNFSYSPAAILLALSTATAVRDNSNWIQAFSPTPKTGLDLRDCGALNIEANLERNPSQIGEKMDIKAANFTLTSLNQYIAALYRPGLVLSIDVPEYGASNWFLSLFTEAASVGQHAASARNFLIHAANQLTNNHFGKYFHSNAPIFSDVQRVHMGYYTDSDGNRRDIRDYDYIAVANLINKNDPGPLRDWSDTYYRTDYPEEQRLHARLNLLRNMVTGIEITGFAKRITFSVDFIDALVSGEKDAGLSSQIQTPLSYTDFNQQRGVGTFIGTALMNPADARTFMARSANYQSYNQPYTVQNGRWNY